MKVVESVVLDTDEVESQKKSHADASFGFFSQLSFQLEQLYLKFLNSKLLST